MCGNITSSITSTYPHSKHSRAFVYLQRVVEHCFHFDRFSPRFVGGILVGEHVAVIELLLGRGRPLLLQLHRCSKEAHQRVERGIGYESKEKDFLKKDSAFHETESLQHSERITIMFDNAFISRQEERE